MLWKKLGSSINYSDLVLRGDFTNYESEYFSKIETVEMPERRASEVTELAAKFPNLKTLNIIEKAIGIDSRVTPEMIQAILPYIDNIKVNSEYTADALHSIIRQTGNTDVLLLNNGKNIANLRNIKRDNSEVMVGLRDLSRK